MVENKQIRIILRFGSFDETSEKKNFVIRFFIKKSAVSTFDMILLSKYHSAFTPCAINTLSIPFPLFSPPFI